MLRRSHAPDASGLTLTLAATCGRISFSRNFRHYQRGVHVSCASSSLRVPAESRHRAPRRWVRSRIDEYADNGWDLLHE